MSLATHCTMLLEEHSLPCVLADLQTGNVLYVNEKFKLLHNNEKNLIGEKFYELMKDNRQSYSLPPNFDWGMNEILELEIYVDELKRHFIIGVTRLSYEGEFYLLCKFTPLEESTEEFTFEEAMTRCITVLQIDDEEKIPNLLKILGKFYGSEKAYLYQVNRKEMKIPCKNSWTKDESIVVTPDLSDKLNVSRLLEWFETRNEVGILEAARSHASFSEHTMEYDVLTAYNLYNLVMSVVEDSNGEALGLVIVSNRENTGADLRLLQAVTGFIEKDISKTEVKSTLEEINARDMLTGFYSRVNYSETVDSFQKSPPKTLGVVFTNVNGLKKINSEFGYAKGDSYIKKASEIMREHFSRDFYRISGDEFVAFFPDCSKCDLESEVISMQQKMKENGEFIFAVGHAWSEKKIDCESLIKEADTVMYINKQEYYRNSNRRLDEITDSTLSDLLKFLDNDEFMIYLQPQVKLKDGSLYGAEALIRRFDKTNQKMVFPDQFIPLYEKKSVIRHVDIFVVERVCQLLHEWSQNKKEIPISVNLSRVTLLEYDIANTIAEICDKYQVPRHLVVIEVTERVGLIENNVASTLITQFKENGFTISLDDFGCAYSNIVTLAQIEVNEVKLDKSLVDDLVTNEKNSIIVKNVLAMCNELPDTSTLAEGIEVEEQSVMLHEYGCHLGQGYFYSRPVPVDEFFEKYIAV